MSPARADDRRPVRRGAYPEFTWPAVIVGYFLGSIIAVSIGYAALILGFSIEGSELAAILGWAILRGLMRRTSIIENNINQTIASSVNGASAGLMFTLPALFILDRAGVYPGITEFNRVLMVLAAVTGGVLGLAFIIPLRKQMIDFNRLAYPGGIAVGAILKSPGAGMRKAMLLLGGAAVSGAFHLVVLNLPAGLSHVEGENFALGALVGAPPILNLTFYLSLLTIGVGFLSGRGGLIFGLGGFLCYWVLGPLLLRFGALSGPHSIAEIAAAGPEGFRAALFRPTGIGMLIGAAVGGIVAAFPLIRGAMKSMHEAQKGSGAGGSDEIPIRFLYAAIGIGFVALLILAQLSTEHMTWGRALGMAGLGTLWIWVAGVIVSESLGRTNWSPLSGMTLIAVTILIFIASGMASTEVMVASMVVGVAICVAIAMAGDMMLDLKAGYLVGATPRKQQLAQLTGNWLGPVLIMALAIVLQQAYGLGSDRLPAPQATALAGVMEGIVGGDVPAYRYAAGAGLGAMLAFSGLGGIGVLIGLGFYMPFNIVLTYTIGNLVRIAVDRTKGNAFVENVGIPVAAGLIVGEALVGVANALWIVFTAAAGQG
ncbi:MAG: oligopeptide transporter OPT family protein [Candidatus Eisenbacteria bacterium]|nr:oligopeptide transporter OPT family protein [Candidatus Latescibacterota bacterium]MBD3301139.1 oligopeptide transporter OPT family protein [Candidatus Eisenbacteria bacterium]